MNQSIVRHDFQKQKKFIVDWMLTYEIPILNELNRFLVC